MRKCSLIEIFPDIEPVKIVDIGALFTGEENSAYGSLLKAGKAEIIGFEPNPSECDKLNRLHGAPHRFFPHFIGDGQEHTFYETNYVGTGSLLKPNTPLLEKFQGLNEVTTLVQTHVVQTRRLDDIAEITDADFVKIDVQGSELMIFQNASRILSRAMVIQTEVCFLELYENQPTFGDLDGFLRQSGFQFHTFTGFGQRCFKPMYIENRPTHGLRQYIWSDGVYIRDFMKLDALPVNKMMKMALIAHDLFQSYDLCLLLLTEVDRKTSGGLANTYLQAVSGA